MPVALHVRPNGVVLSVSSAEYIAAPVSIMFSPFIYYCQLQVMDRVHKLYYPKRGITWSESYSVLILLLEIVIIMLHCSLLRIFYFLLILDSVVSDVFLCIVDCATWYNLCK